MPSFVMMTLLPAAAASGIVNETVLSVISADLPMKIKTNKNEENKMRLIMLFEVTCKYKISFLE